MRISRHPPLRQLKLPLILPIHGARREVKEALRMSVSRRRWTEARRGGRGRAASCRGGVGWAGALEKVTGRLVCLFCAVFSQRTATGGWGLFANRAVRRRRSQCTKMYGLYSGHLGRYGRYMRAPVVSGNRPGGEAKGKSMAPSICKQTAAFASRLDTNF